jgi:pyrroloquinoline quinone (PQQ) biosynthesis protein C
MVGEALKHHYAMSPKDIEFFTAHCEMDIEHSEKTLALVVKHSRSAEIRERVKGAVRDMTEKTIEWSVAVSDLVMAEPA